MAKKMNISEERYGGIMEAINVLIHSGNTNIKEAATENFGRLLSAMEQQAYKVSEIVGECQEDYPDLEHSDNEWKEERPFYNLGNRFGQMIDEWPDEFEVVE